MENVVLVCEIYFRLDAVSLQRGSVKQVNLA